MDQELQSAEKLKTTLVTILFMINGVFLAFITLYQLHQGDNAKTYAQMEDTLVHEQIVNTYHRHFHKYYLLKNEILDDMKRHKKRETVIPKIIQAQDELDAILALDRLETVITDYNADDIITELYTMRNLETELSSIGHE